jgi:hypothetical protein
MLLTIGTPVYVEAGGSRFIARNGTGQDEINPGLFTMDLAVSSQQHTMLAASGGNAVPARSQAALACTPDGRAFLFGGLSATTRSSDVEGLPDTQWQPTNSLHLFKLSGSVSQPSLIVHGHATNGSAGHPLPAPRSGHAMAYLPPGVVSGLGMRAGALVMYGGSNITATGLFELLDEPAINNTEITRKLSGISWDTSTCLYDLGKDQWVQLATAGSAPPGLMYASMEAHGEQVGPT